MKKSIKSFVKLLFPIIFLASCSNFLDMNLNETNDNIEYSSLTINGNDQSGRLLNVSDVSYAKIYISGSDISTDKEAELTLQNVPLENGRNKDTITIEKIPVGKNRIVTVVPFRKDGSEIKGHTLRAVTDILPGPQNKVTVDKTSTSYGNIVYELKEFFTDLNNPGEKTIEELEKLKAAVDTTVHPALYDYKNLTSGYKAFSPIMDKSYYVLKAQSFTFDYFLNDNITVSIDDPVSADVTFDKAGKGKSISNVAPGTWNLYVKDSSGTILEKTEITVRSNTENKIGHLPHQGIAVLVNKAKNYDCIHYWDSSDPETYASTKWPGVKMTKVVKTENADGSEYYVYDFENVTSVNCLITNSSGGKYHSENIELKYQGVFDIHSSDISVLTEAVDTPDDFELSKLPLTEENYKTFYYDDSENKRIVMLLNPEIDTNNLNFKSAKVKFNHGINDVTGFDGAEFSFIKHTSGIWYALVPYNKIRGPNQSGQPTYKITLNNSNTYDCVKFLKDNNLDGYIYYKYNGKEVSSKLPVIIFNYQDKQAVIQSFKDEKKEKKPSDYDLTKEEDQKKIANFRLVPGTTKLFRSYHPYVASKSSFDTEPYRLYYLAKLAEKYGIKADLQVGSETSVSTGSVKIYNGSNGTKTVSNYLPDYYKKISDAKNIYFMYTESGNKWGYDVGYFNQGSNEDNAKNFARYMGTMIKFINTHEGPYQIHCSIGTDRTGTTCGILAALCGASYSEIAKDYCSSQNMGIFEYRGEGCIRYVLEEFIRIDDISDTTQVPDLQNAVIQRLVKYGNVTESEVKQCINALGGKLPD